MAEAAPPAVFAILVWWLGTGVVLYLVRRPPGTFPRTLGWASVAAALCLWGLFLGRDDTSLFGAYAAFTCSVVVWGSHEVAFLTGHLTGPRHAPCPAGTRVWRRFWYASLTVIHHECALALTLLAVVALTYGGVNQVGAETFFVLWIMRLSAKLNLFVGVRNFAQEFIPEHLKYLLSYLRTASLSPLMVLTVALATGALAWLLRNGLMRPATEFGVTATSLVGTLLALAILEHLFLAFPMNDVALWRWAFRARGGAHGLTRPDSN